jgi:Tol biopolymer transport system component
MNRSTIIAAFFVLVFFAGQCALAQSGYNLFQKGLIQERVKGDLDEAIKVYERIIVKFPNNRPIVAKALLHIGLCYEKMGKQEAQRAYQRLIKEYGDQPEPVQTAREHLEQLDAGAPGTKVNGPTYRLVLDDQIAGMPVGPRDVSPTDDWIVFRSQDKLYIADQTATVIRPILDDSGPWKYPNSLRWSPDGRLIAYTAAKEVTSDSSKSPVQAIFVLSPDGGAPRQIGPERTWYQNIRRLHWTPDGKHLTGVRRDGLYMLALDGSEVRFIPGKDLPGRYHVGLSDGEYSPNGRWLAYCTAGEYAENHEKDIWILPATGGKAQPLTHLPGPNGYPTWAPDGRTLYFVSGTKKIGNIWKLAIDPETGLQKGKPQQVTFFNDTDITAPRVLGDGDRIAFQMLKRNTSIQVADASSLNESRALVPGYSPQPSPDGQTIYYFHGERGERGIFAVPREGGTPRRLTPSRPGASHSLLLQFDLSPDGRTLAYVTKLGDGQGFVTLPVSGGEPHLMVEFAEQHYVLPRWSPDGSQLAYAAGKGLYVIPAAGGKPRELAHLKEWEGWTVRWSPDGKFIAALGYDNDPKESSNAVFVVPASGGEPRQLTPDVEYKEGLEWHPDGKRLTYHISRYHSETRQVYLDGRPPSLLLDAPDIWDYVGIWAPDGSRFIFSGSVQGNWGVYAYDEVSGKTTLVSNAGLPRWSRDGKTAAWGATRSTSLQTWIMENFLPESKAGE